MSEKLAQILKKRPLVYVARDIERALGLEPRDGYFIVTNRTPYAEEIHRKHPENVRLIDSSNEGVPLDINKLLVHPEVSRMLHDKNPYIVVFKNTLQIERICAQNGFTLLNPSALLANTVEEKITQIDWLTDFASYLPPFEVCRCRDLSYEGTPFILQFNHGHTGQGTHFIDNAEKVEDMKKIFPERLAKKSDYIDGPVYTQNIVVAENAIVPGNISLHITGLSPFTDLPFSTIGNDYAIPHNKLAQEQKGKISEIATAIGSKLQKEKWKGLFGIDIKIDKKRGAVYLLEINARQPASTTFESKLQSQSNQQNNPKKETIFELHLLSLLGEYIPDQLPSLSEGSQIVQRVTDTITSVDHIDMDGLRAIASTVITYPITSESKPNNDLIRIQLTESIMSSETKLNDLGKKIVHYLSR